MQRLPVLAFVLIMASCTRADLTRPRIGLVPRPADDATGNLASEAVQGAIAAAAQGKAELLVAEGLDLQSARSGRGDALFEERPKALAIDTAGDGFLDPLVKRAKSERVPVVFYGLEPSRESMRSWDKLFFVGSRRSEFGAAQGEMLAAYWKANPSADHNKDGELQFVALTAQGEDHESGLQTEAAEKALAASGVPNRVLAQESVEDEVAAARKKAAALIAAYGDRIEAFLCRDDDMALGAAEALKAAGYAKAKRRVPVVGANVADESAELRPAVAAAIESEAVLGTVFPDREAEGKAVFDIAYALARGTAPSRTGWKISDAKYVWVPCRKIEKENLPPKD